MEIHPYCIADAHGPDTRPYPHFRFGELMLEAGLESRPIQSECAHPGRFAPTPSDFKPIDRQPGERLALSA